MLSPEVTLGRKLLQSRGPLQGRSSRTLRSPLWHTGVSFPSRGALKQSGNGHGTQAYPRSEERPPGKATAPNSDLTGPSSSVPQRRRQVDLSQNGYFVSLSLSLSFFRQGYGLSLSLSTRQEGKHGPVQPPARARAPAVHGRVRNILVGGSPPQARLYSVWPLKKKKSPS